MITRERAAEILRLYHAEKWKPGTIARQLGVHHTTVRRVLAQAGQAPGLISARPSMADPFVPLIRADAGEVSNPARLVACTRWCAAAATPVAPIISATSFRATAGDRWPKPICGCGPCRGSRPRSIGGISARCGSGVPSARCGDS